MVGLFDVRREFPVVNDLLYFDAAAMTPVPLAVQGSVIAEQAHNLSLGTADSRGSVRERELSAVRLAAGRLLSVETEHVAIASSAMAVLRDALWQLRLEGGNVVVLRDDYPDLVRACRQFCDARSLELRAVDSPCADAEHDIASLRAASDVDTRVIAVTNVHPWTGRELLLNDLTQLADSTNAFLVVDASQAAGALPMAAGAVDLLVASGYKWLCGGLGAAVAVASDRLLVACATAERPLTAAEVLEPSTMSPFSTACLRRSMEYILELGVPQIEAHNRALTTRLRQGLADLEATFATSDGSAAPHILSAAFEGCDNAHLTQQLVSAGVIVSLRENWVRWAPHLYTSESDVDRALAVLAEVLPTAAAA